MPIKTIDSFEIPKTLPLDLLTRMDELLIENIKAVRDLRGLVSIVLPTPALDNRVLKESLLSGQQIPYEIVGGTNGLSLATARTDVPFNIQGTQLTINTNGSLEGITIRFNNLNTHPVPIRYFNPWYQPFFKIYLTHTAQAAKTLYLMATREAAGTIGAAGTFTYAISAEFLNKVSAILDSTTANLADGATYTGAAFSVEQYAYIVGSVYSNRAGTLYVEQTEDGTNYDIQETLAYVAGALQGWYNTVLAPNARVRFTNAAGAATATFRLYARARRV